MTFFKTGLCMSTSRAIRMLSSLIEQQAGDPQTAADYDRMLNTIRYALRKTVPVEPCFRPGRYGRKYDNYTCGVCGAGVNDIGYKYCPNCGQRLTDDYLGRRATTEEQMRGNDDIDAADIALLAAEIEKRRGKSRPRGIEDGWK